MAISGIYGAEMGHQNEATIAQTGASGISVSSAVAAPGSTYSWRVNPTASSGYFGFRQVSAGAVLRTFAQSIRFKFRIDTMAAAYSNIATIYTGTSLQNHLRLHTDGSIALHNAANVLQATSAAGLFSADAQWHRLEWDCGYSAGVGQRLYLDGNLIVSAAASTITLGNEARFGMLGNSGSPNFYYDNIVFYNSAITAEHLGADYNVGLLRPDLDSAIGGWRRPDGTTTTDLNTEVDNVPPWGTTSTTNTTSPTPNGTTGARIENTVSSTTDNFDAICYPYDTLPAGPIVSTYYLDGTGGISDPNSNWLNDADAFDASTATGATSSATSTQGTGYLHGQGTTAPSGGTSRIQSVRARLHGGVATGTQVRATIYTDALGQSLGTPMGGGTFASPNWGSYVLLSEPTGGWTWPKVAALEAKIASGDTATSIIADLIEIEVTSYSVANISILAVQAICNDAQAVTTGSPKAGAVAIESVGTSVVVPGGASIYGVGGDTTDERRAQTFIAIDAFVTHIDVSLQKLGTPTDNLVFEIQGDSGGVPSGSSIGSGSISCASLTTSAVTYRIALETQLTVGSTYWLIASRTGANNVTNLPRWLGSAAGTSNYAGGNAWRRNAGTWESQTFDLTVTFLNSPQTEQSFDYGLPNGALGSTSAAAMGTFPAGWGTHVGPVTENPTVTLTSGPTVRVGKRTATTREVDVDFLGVYVMWKPRKSLPPLPPNRLRPILMRN